MSVVEKASGTKAAPKNVPSGKVFSKNELEEIEKRRHGAELRQVLTTLGLVILDIAIKFIKSAFT